MADLRLLGLELEREIRLTQQEIFVKRNLLDETKKKLQVVTSELQLAKTELNQNRNEIQELKNQLQNRLKASQKIEEENSQIRDALAKLQVERESYNIEKQQLTDRCLAAETDASKAKNKVMELQNELEDYSSFKESCLIRQSQIKSLIDQILKKQELLNKDQVKLERSCQEGLSFAAKISEEANYQSEFVQEANVSLAKLEKQLIRVTSALEETRKERDLLLESKNRDFDKGQLYMEEWSRYRQEMKTRIEALIDQNKKLSEELERAKIQIELSSKKRGETDSA